MFQESEHEIILNDKEKDQANQSFAMTAEKEDSFEQHCLFDWF